MIGKYVMMVLGAAIIGLLLKIWFMSMNIDDKEAEIKLLESQLIACNLSQESLRTTIETQNEKIGEFNLILEETNIALVEITEENENLEKDLELEINKIDIVTHDTCKDTINWMLKEAIESNEKTNPSSTN